MRPVADSKKKSHLVGEALREIAVLMFVLYPLEAYLDGKFNWCIFVLVAVFAAASFGGGLYLGGEEQRNA